MHLPFPELLRSPVPPFKGWVPSITAEKREKGPPGRTLLSLPTVMAVVSLHRAKTLSLETEYLSLKGENLHFLLILFSLFPPNDCLCYIKF